MNSKRKKRKRISTRAQDTSLFLVLLLSLLSTHSNGAEHFSPLKDWQTLQSEHIYLNFERKDQAIAEHALQIAEQALQQLSKALAWQPKTRVQVVISDQQDMPNGYATPLPFNRTVIFLAPPSGFIELSDYDEWLRTLLLHELSHIVHLDKARNFTETPRSIVGRNLFLFPNVFQPALFKEGLATYLETSWQRGVGRGQSAYYQMMMRTEVATGLLPLSKAQQLTHDWPLNKAYTYGVYFYQFLDERYGPESIPSYIETYSGQLWPFLVDRPVRHNTDQPGLNELWLAYQDWLEQRFRPQIQRIQQAGISQFERLSDTGYVNGKPYLDHQGNTYFARFDPYHPSYLTRVDVTGKEEQLTPMPVSAEIVGSNDSTLWYLKNALCEHNTSSFDLFAYDLTEQSSERLTYCQHYTQGDIKQENGKTLLIAIKETAGLKQLVQYELNTATETPLYQGEFDESFGSPRWLPNHNSVVLTHKKSNEAWKIDRFDIPSRKLSTIHADPEVGFYTVSISADGKYLYTTSDAQNLLEIWRMNIDGSDLRQMTRSLGGASHAVVDDTNTRLVYRHYGENGWDIVSQPLHTVTSTHIAKLPIPGSGFEAEWKDNVLAEFTQENYQSWRSVWPTSWWLSHASDEAHSTTLLNLSGQDALGFHSWILNLGRDTKNGHNVGQVSYTLYNHLTLSYERTYDFGIGGNDAPAGFVDEKVSEEKTTNLAATFQFTFPLEIFTFKPLPFLGRGLEALPISWFAGINREEERHVSAVSNAEFAFKKVNTYGAGFRFDTTTNTFRSISPSFGRRIQMTIERDKVTQVNYAQAMPVRTQTKGNVWSIDWKEYIHLYQAHTLELALFEGRAETGADRFDLHGDISSSLFNQNVLHNRDLLLRGYPDETPELIGRKAEIYSANYHFPIASIDEGWASWPIGLRGFHGTVFFESGKANEIYDHYDSAGIELTSGLDLGFGLLPLDITAGLAFPLKQTFPNPDKDSHAYARLGIGF